MRQNKGGITPEDYIDDGGPSGEYDVSFINKYGGRIYNTLYVIAIIIAVIAVMVVGVKYIFGSIEEKADYKKNLIPIVVGIVLVVVLLTVVSIIVDVAQDI